MLRLRNLAFSLAAVATMLLSAFAAPANGPLGSAAQLVVVTTSEWSATQGTLLRFERNGNRWRRVGDPVRVVVGRSGMGWGSGTADHQQTPSSPVKQEGDGRSPAGVFPIGAAFGYDTERPSWLKLPYIPLNSATECVDDPSSNYYNSVVDRIPNQPAGWNSSEKMRQIGLYRWGVIVNQNATRHPGAGSCIFLHIWNGPASTTAGCTAMQQGDLKDLMRWLNVSAHPVLVALPIAEYEGLRTYWQLPPL